MSIQTQTFPGVYSSVRDASFLPVATSRYHAGIIGPAEKGPFDVVTSVRSLKDYRAKFGRSIPEGFTAIAAGLLADLSDGTQVVRVGHQYRPAAVQNTSGSEGGYTVNTPSANQVSVNDYIRITQPGLPTTVNAKVAGVASGQLTLVSSGNEAKFLAANYTGASVDRSALSGAANPAEAFLFANTYGAVISRLGTAVGDKNTYRLSLSGYGSNLTPWTGAIATITKQTGQTTATATTSAAHGLATGDTLTVSGANTTGFNGLVTITRTTSTTFTYPVAADLSPDSAGGSPVFAVLQVGDLILIQQSSHATTREVRVAELLAGQEASGSFDAVDPTIVLEPSDKAEVGYRALPLQDSYTAGQIKKVIRSDTPVMHLKAASAGTWANSDGAKTGLIVTVRAGSAPDTKKFEVYDNGALVESIDNLSPVKQVLDATSGQLVPNPDYYVVRINGRSAAVSIAYTADGAAGECAIPANTINPWNRALAAPLNIAAFSGGYNGANPQDEDYIGTVDTSDDSQSGLKAFDDPDNLDISTICAPGNTSIAVAQEIARIARKINAAGIIDAPQGLNAREATDWHNGAGLYAFRGRLDTYSLSCYFNWLTVVDPFTGVQRRVPPSLGVMRATARVYDREKPWAAAAGEERGLIPEAIAVEFPRISSDARNGMVGAGNCLNPIMLFQGTRIMVYGDRTMQRAESKLTATHTVHLINHLIKGMAAIGRPFVFDPNDSELLLHLRLAYTGFLDTVMHERGIEDFLLQVDGKNNTAATRNDRSVIVDLAVVPVDVMERLYLNLTVRESGAVLNSVN